MVSQTTLIKVTGNWTIPANSKPQVTVTVSISAPSPLDSYLAKGLTDEVTQASIVLLSSGTVVQQFSASISAGTSSVTFSGTGNTVSSQTTIDTIEITIPQTA